MNQTPEEPELATGDLSSEQEESVRRLLAEARAAAPMPEAVRARLEGVLRQLGAVEGQGAASSPPAPLIDLAARRRRRVRAVFLAAAAVTAFGVALPQLLPVTGGDQSSVFGTADDAPAGATAEEYSTTDGDDSAAEEPEAGQQDTTAPSAPPTLREDRFAEDAQAVRDRAYLTNGLSEVRELAPECLGASEDSATAGRAAIAVRYAGRDAALLLGTPVNGTQRAILYVCGESEPRRTAVLTVR